jgi:hypothetical protein
MHSIYIYNIIYTYHFLGNPSLVMLQSLYFTETPWGIPWDPRYAQYERMRFLPRTAENQQQPEKIGKSNLS